MIFVILSASCKSVFCDMDNIVQRKPGLSLLLPMIIYVWAGMIIGISFLEAPLKFQAPQITLALGLGIGKLVFGALNRTEILFAVILAAIGFFGKVSNRFWYLFAMLSFLLLLQSAWLLPALDERAQIIINGGASGEGSLHLYYVAAEFLKLIFLITLGIRIQSDLLKSNRRQQ